MKKIILFSAFAVNIFLGIVIATIIFFNEPANNHQAFAETKKEKILSKKELSAMSLQETYTHIARINTPAVVSLHVTTITVREYSPFSGFFQDEMLREFFGLPRRQYKKRGTSFGSGFIISEDGYLVSNYHVIRNAETITVKLKGDEKEYSADIIGTDPDSDVALLKIRGAEDMPHVTLGDSDTLKPGHIAVAIGNPFGLSSTFTTGVISAIGRTGIGNTYENFIQTDVAINPGNSGGPLLNLKGEVIGINSMIYSESGGSIGIGFAIPINMAKRVIEQLKKNGKVIRGWLGVHKENINAEMASALGISFGVYIPEVHPHSPAEKAGIKAGDIVTKYNGKKIRSVKDLENFIGQSVPGETVTVTILRKNQKISLKVTIEVPDDSNTPSANSCARYLGITAGNIPPSILRRYGRTQSFGVYIEKVSPGSPLGEKGVRAGDIIRMINNTEVKNIKRYKELLSQIPRNSNIVIHIQRGNYLHMIVVNNRP